MASPVTYTTVQTLELRTRHGCFAYRRLGPSGGRALVLLQHFRGSLDRWDPALIDALSEDRDVVVFDNAGVGRSTGRTPRTMTEMAYGAIDFIDTLGLSTIDLLGYSIGGAIAQEMALIRPDLIHRLILASAAPQGAPGMHGWAPAIIEAIGTPHTTGPGMLSAFFKDTVTSQAAGKAFLQRVSARASDRDAATNWEVRQAHYDAVATWGIPNHASLERVAAISQPVFVANGDADQMILPRYSHLLAGLLPNAALKIYPDAAHGFLFQHHAEFAADVTAFLTA